MVIFAHLFWTTFV